MPKKTFKGVEAERQIKGFKLFMETAEKYRQQFYEKENILDNFLPYAILFGITKEWLKKIRQIYGDEYIEAHQPIWYFPAVNSVINSSNFENTIESLLSSRISQKTASSSGSRGLGSSGGGRGVGGGGGW